MNRKSNSELRHFGLIFLGYILLFYFLFLKMHHESFQPKGEWISLLIFALFFLIFPVILIPINTAWDFILKILHWVNTRVLLGAIFFLVFSPISLFKKIVGKDTFGLNFDYRATSYRTPIMENNDIRNPY